MIDWINDIVSAYSTQFSLIVVLTYCFGTLSMVYLALLFSQKIKKRKKAFFKRRHWDKIEEALATIMIQSIYDESSDIDYKSALNLLKRSVKKSSLIGQWLLEEIIRQKSNLSGDSAKTLMKVYNQLGLKSLSLKKLKNRRWDIKAHGIMELERMQQGDSFILFYDFLHSKHKDLRKTARLGLTSLAPNPIDFLDHLNEELSEWEQLNIANRLSQRSREQLPDFSRFYDHSQPTVIAFCVRMSVKFGVYDHIPDIIDLVGHSSTQVQVAAIEGLSDLGAYQAHKEIYSLAFRTESEEVMVSCLKFLASVGSKKHKYLVERMLSHKSIAVRMEAVNTAIQLDLEFDEMPNELKEMYLHHQHELI